MSGTSSDYRLIETLTRSAEIILRRLIRFLVGKISLVNLQEMLRSIYVEEAEENLKIANPKKNVALTKLALLTGLDTRTLTKIRNSENYRKPSHKRKAFMREASPMTLVLDYWTSVEEFIDPGTRKPKILNLKGERESFERLFAMTINSRGITPQSTINRLKEAGAVRVDEKNQTIELIKNSYLATHTEDQLGIFEIGYVAVANLMDTIVHNFESESKSDKYFQRSVWTLRLPIQRRFEAKQQLTSVLDAAEQNCRNILIKEEELSEHSEQMTAGVSIFYFEDNLPCEEK